MDWFLDMVVKKKFEVFLFNYLFELIASRNESNFLRDRFGIFFVENCGSPFCIAKY